MGLDLAPLCLDWRLTMRKNYCLESFENIKNQSGGSTVYLRGWYLTKNDFPQIEVFSNGKQVAAKIDVLNRRDVLQAFPDQVHTADCGFVVRADFPDTDRDFVLKADGQQLLHLSPSEFRSSLQPQPFIFEIVLIRETEYRYRLNGFGQSPEGQNVKPELYSTRCPIEDLDVVEVQHMTSPFYFLDEDSVGFSIGFTAPDGLEGIMLKLSLNKEEKRIPLSLAFSRPEILKNNLRVMGHRQLYPLWKANGTRFLARRIFRQNLYTTVNNVKQYSWYEENTPDKKQLEKQRKETFPWNPKISLVSAAYNTNLALLDEMIQSLENQTYSNWELCLADGSTNEAVCKHIKNNYSNHPKIRYSRLNENLGISGNTNKALEMATGDYIGFIDHDDTLREDALYEVVKAVNERPYAFLYSDEDKIINNNGKLGELFFKPDFSLDYLLSTNYFNHFSVVRADIQKDVGNLRSEFDGAQDYDFVLRVVERVDPKDICHIAKPLYHWRMTNDSTALNPKSKKWAFDAGRRAIQDYLDRNHLNATATDGESFGLYHVDYQMETEPMISVIIPNMDHTDELDVLLKSIRDRIDYDNYEILVVENNSRKQETFQYYEQMEKEYPKVRLLHWDRPFNYSAINNFAFEQAKGDYILLMNNDMEVIDPDLFRVLASNASRDGIGAVGAKLLYKDGTIQHNGVLWGIDGGCHLFLAEPNKGPSYGHQRFSQRNVAAVTGACLMVSREKYAEVGGLDEKYRVAYNDVDFCLKLIKAGYSNVICPQVRMYHYESLSRGMEDTPEKLERFYGELDRLTENWIPFFPHGDPYYSPNLSLTRGFYTPRTKDEEKDYLLLQEKREARKKERAARNRAGYPSGSLTQKERTDSTERAESKAMTQENDDNG